MAGNSNLRAAKKAKNDEFYTQLTDIEKELRYYKKHFKGKTVFCNCDDPFESNFFKYFVLNFNRLGLKKLICTCYSGSPVSKYRDGSDRPYKAVVTTVHDTDGDGGIDMTDVKTLFENGENELTPLHGDGDFRSDECLDLMGEADIVVTNPPFSLFREYVNVLMEHRKKFAIIGSQNAITYKEIFPMLKKNIIWLGMMKPKEFIQRDGSIKIFGNICWYTNLDIKKRHEELILVKRYNPEDYPKYDNYNAINVNKVSDIPCDYAGAMGVPITFLDKYCPEQFDILGITLGNTVDYPMTGLYKNAVQHNKNGTIQGGSKVNTRAAILVNNKPMRSVYYTAANVDGYLLSTYPRILIRNKHPEAPKEV